MSTLTLARSVVATVVLASGSAGANRLEAQLTHEINRLRADPAGYSAMLEAWLPHYDGLVLRYPGRPAVRTAEGAAALKEAIQALRGAEPARALAPAAGLILAARDHAVDIGPRGLVSHRGSLGETLRDRVVRHGDRYENTAQSLTFGPTDAQTVLFNLLVDDSVSSRNHRKMLLDRRFMHVGVACAPHTVFRMVCVLNFGGRRMTPVSVSAKTPTPSAAMRR